MGMDSAFKIVFTIICCAEVCQDNKDLSWFKQPSHSQVRCCFTWCQKSWDEFMVVFLPETPCISCLVDYPACVSVQMLLHECRPSVCHSFVSFWDRCHHRYLQQSPAAHILAAVPLQTVVHSFKMWLCWQYIEYVSMWINVTISVCILVQVSPAHLKTWTDKCWLGTSLCTDLHAGVMVQMKEGEN